MPPALKLEKLFFFRVIIIVSIDDKNILTDRAQLVHKPGNQSNQICSESLCLPSTKNIPTETDVYQFIKPIGSPGKETSPSTGSLGKSYSHRSGRCTCHQQKELELEPELELELEDSAVDQQQTGGR